MLAINENGPNLLFANGGKGADKIEDVAHVSSEKAGDCELIQGDVTSVTLGRGGDVTVTSGPTFFFIFASPTYLGVSNDFKHGVREVKTFFLKIF